MPERENDKDQGATQTSLEYIVECLTLPSSERVQRINCGTNEISASKTRQIRIKIEIAPKRFHRSLKKSHLQRRRTAGM